VQGLCPLTPEEAVLVLKALGFQKDTQIYIAAGEIFGGAKRLALLKESFPRIVSFITFNITHFGNDLVMMVTCWFFR